jgi:hypothetical protein
LAEPGLDVDRTTVYRWVRRFLPLLVEAARRYRHPVGGRWRVDEIYGRLNGRWAYCYRAVDQEWWTSTSASDATLRRGSVLRASNRDDRRQAGAGRH